MEHLQPKTVASMPAPLSVVIPTLEAASTISPTLRSLFEGVEEGLIRELIICDGKSMDDIESLADKVGASFLRTKPGRGRQLAAGAEAARGSWILLLHADTILEPGWSSRVRTHIESRPHRAACFRLKFDVDSIPAKLVACWANFRSRYLSLPFGDQGLLILAELLEDKGGIPRIPLMEDVVLSRKLRGHIDILDSFAETASVNYTREGWIRRGAKNLLTQYRFFRGVSPERLAESYRRQFREGE